MERRIAFLRPHQIQAEMERAPVVFLPLGPLEWHGPHLPYGTDALNAEAVARQVAEQTGGLVLPALYWGTERERDIELLDWLGFPPDAWVVGMDFPGNSLPSCYAPEEIFALIVREQLRQVMAMGFRLAVLVSGHGATNHLAVLDRLAAEFNAPRSPMAVLPILAFSANEEGLLEVGHASRVETSILLALHPETVEVERLPAGPESLPNTAYAIVDYLTFAGHPTPDHTVHAQDDPRLASAEEGRLLLLRTVAELVSQVRAALEHIQSNDP